MYSEVLQKYLTPQKGSEATRKSQITIKMRSGVKGQLPVSTSVQLTAQRGLARTPWNRQDRQFLRKMIVVISMDLGKCQLCNRQVLFAKEVEMNSSGKCKKIQCALCNLFAYWNGKIS